MRPFSTLALLVVSSLFAQAALADDSHDNLKTVYGSERSSGQYEATLRSAGLPISAGLAWAVGRDTEAKAIAQANGTGTEAATQIASK
jgi:hypothetical protein